MIQRKSPLRRTGRIAAKPTRPKAPAWTAPEDLRLRIANGSIRDASTGCWNWTGPIRADGYPAPISISNFHPGKRVFWVYRVAYELWKGPIAAGLHIDHVCRNKKCVNPAHLEAVTPKDNLYRSEQDRIVIRREMVCKNGHDLRVTGVAYIAGRPDRLRCRRCKTDWQNRFGRRAS